MENKTPDNYCCRDGNCCGPGSFCCRNNIPHLHCDRCQAGDTTVVVRTNCEICGPTPLCDDCYNLHLNELIEET